VCSHVSTSRGQSVIGFPVCRGHRDLPAKVYMYVGEYETSWFNRTMTLLPTIVSWKAQWNHSFLGGRWPTGSFAKNIHVPQALALSDNPSP
jgi:hypothetical protein